MSRGRKSPRRKAVALRTAIHRRKALIAATIFWLLFTTRLWRIRDLALLAQSSGEPIASGAARQWKFGLAFFVLALACVIAILVLMISKPV